MKSRQLSIGLASLVSVSGMDSTLSGTRLSLLGITQIRIGSRFRVHCEIRITLPFDCGMGLSAAPIILWLSCVATIHLRSSVRVNSVTGRFVRRYLKLDRLRALNGFDRRDGTKYQDSPPSFGFQAGRVCPYKTCTQRCVSVWTRS